MAAHSYPLDPHDILGLAPGAPLDAIRDAYREQAKRYHPDHGGDAWAFRVVAWAYQTLGTARVVGRASEEMSRAAGPAPAPGPGAAAAPRPGPVPTADAADGRVRRGYRDKDADPERTVEVELLLLRFEVTDPMELLSRPAEDRLLSCSLNVCWPSRSATAPPPEVAGPALHFLAEAFDAAATAGRSRPISARSHVDGGRFAGWLSFPTVARAEAAFETFHAELNRRGLFVAQSIRDIFVPRDWR